MTEFADLVVRIDASTVAAGVKSLDALTAAGTKAEKSTEKLTATQRGLGQSTAGATSPLREMAEAIKRVEAEELAAARSANQLVAANERLASSSTKAGMAAKGAAVSFVDFHDAASRDFATQYSRQMGAVGQTHMAGVKSSKALTQATLNMTRQFADVGATAAMGMSPLMILIQQGPQIADAFQMAKSQGLGFSAVLAGLRAQVVGLLAVLAPFLIAAGAIAAVIGGPLLLATKELNDGNKDLAKGLGLTDEQMKKVKNQGVTMGDVLNGTFIAAGAALKEAFAPQLEWLSGAISATYQFILKATLGAVEGIVKMFGGAIGLLGGLWKNFPAIVGDAVVSGANFALSAVEKMVNGAIGLLNKLIGQANALSAKVGGPQFGELGSVSIGKIANGNAGALSDLRAAQVKGEAAALAGLAGAYKAVEGAILKVAEARIREEAGTAKAAKALRDHTKATKEAIDRSQPIGADMSKVVDLDAVRATKHQAEAIREINRELKQMPEFIDPATRAMEDFLLAANGAGSGVDQLFDGLRNRDWMSAVAGLLRAAKAVQDAFGKNGTNKTTAGKIGAIAGIADGIGQAIGGTAGSVLSGAAGGAMGGVSLALALGGPVGWIAAAGAAIGGLFGLFGSNSKKQAEKEAARQAAAEREAQRQADILAQRRQIELNIVALSGDAIATLAAQREAELAGIDESNKALARQMYAMQDAKKITDERTALEVRYMQATGDEAGILAKARAEEIKGIDATNRALLDLVYAQEDFAGRLAGAKSDLATAYEREASAISATQDKFSALAKTLRDFGDSLDPAASAGGGSYSAARFGFLKTASGTDAESLAGIPDAGRAFLAASAANSKTLLAYQRDLATVRNATRAGENSAMTQASIAEQQLAGIKAQVSGLITLNDSVLSLPAAIAALLAVQATAPTATPATVAPAGPSATSPNWTSYLANNPDVMAWAQSGHGDPTKPIDGQTLEDRAMYHYYNSGMLEGRKPFAAGGVFTNGIVSQPTGFNMGLMGEAGPEAIMPLVRGPRGLGVRAANDDGEIRALREQVAELTTVVRGMASDTAKLRSNIQTATEDGRAMQTEAYA